MLHTATANFTTTGYDSTRFVSDERRRKSELSFETQGCISETVSRTEILLPHRKGSLSVRRVSNGDEDDTFEEIVGFMPCHGSNDSINDPARICATGPSTSKELEDAHLVTGPPVIIQAPAMQQVRDHQC